MSIKFNTIPKKTLYQSILSTSSTFKMSDIEGFNGNDLTAADFGTVAYGVLLNSEKTVMELFSFDPSTIASTSISFVLRGLKFDGDLTTEVAANKLDWTSGSTILIGTDTPQVLQWLKEYIDAAVVAQGVPASDTVPGISIEATQAQVDAKTATENYLGNPYDLFIRPDKLRSTKNHDYIADSVGTDSYAITVVPAITAYSAGQEFTFKAGIGNTSACTLDVCGLGAITIKKNVSSDLATGDILANQIVKVVYDASGNFQLVSLTSGLKDATQMTGVLPIANGGTGSSAYIYAFPQILSTSKTTEDPSSDTNIFATGSMNDGSAFFSYESATVLRRWARDARTGQYMLTHQVDPTLAVASSKFGGIINIGTYIYLFCSDGTNVVVSRFLAADLTGEQVMTVPTVACTVGVDVWTDGVDAYFVSQTAVTTTRKWSVSGTTFSAVTTGSTPSWDKTGSMMAATFWDGTNAWAVFKQYGSGIVVRKLTDIMASAVTDTTVGLNGQASTGLKTGLAMAVNIDATRMYVGYLHGVFDQTAQYTVNINLIPISKP